MSQATFLLRGAALILSDAELRELAEKLERAYVECPAEEVRALRSKSHKIMTYALLTNMGAWGLYLTPVALAGLTYTAIVSVVKKVLSLPESDVDKIVPTDRYART